MAIDLTQFHGAFFEESFEALDSMEAALLKLDVGVPGKEPIDTIAHEATSTRGFRAGAHSLEGLCLRLKAAF